MCKFAILGLLLCGTAAAAPIPPATNGTLDGVPLAEAMASIKVLGEWQLPQGGYVRLLTVISGETLCQPDSDTDTDMCDLETLYVSAYEAPTVPMDHTLFRLPKKINWALAKDTVPRDGGEIELSACRVEKKSGVISLRLEAYVLRIREGIAKSRGHAYTFSADLERVKATATGCFD